MKLSKAIQGSRLQLRTITIEDLPILWQLIYGEADPEYKKWDAPYFPAEREELHDYLDWMSRFVEAGLDSRWCIVAHDKIIGTVSYYWEHQSSNWMEIGIIIYTPAYWSGGYGTEAIKLWVDYLFQAYESIPRLGFTTWSGNHRMIGVGRKLGMIEEARIRKVRIVNGEYYDSVKMGVLREEWEARS